MYRNIRLARGFRHTKRPIQFYKSRGLKSRPNPPVQAGLPSNYLFPVSRSLDQVPFLQWSPYFSSFAKPKLASRQDSRRQNSKASLYQHHPRRPPPPPPPRNQTLVPPQPRTKDQETHRAPAPLHARPIANHHPNLNTHPPQPPNQQTTTTMPSITTIHESLPCTPPPPIPHPPLVTQN